jgi:hypothetical protein
MIGAPLVRGEETPHQGGGAARPLPWGEGVDFLVSSDIITATLTYKVLR